jgi:formate dehydrogenase iron-sulfur subunit
MDKIMATQDPGESIDLLLELCDTMTDASLCAMGTMTPNPVRSAIKYFHEDFDRA